ncbi:MAG: sodium:proline symporter, partial [Clostridia bacterium]|nr:sodium:proline symporter [Clostridia bacterium]
LSGGITVFVWKFVVREVFAGSVLDIYELLPAFIVSCAFIVAVSLCTAKPSAEIEEQFEFAKQA